MGKGQDGPQEGDIWAKLLGRQGARQAGKGKRVLGRGHRGAEALGLDLPGSLSGEEIGTATAA